VYRYIGDMQLAMTQPSAWCRLQQGHVVLRDSLADKNAYSAKVLVINMLVLCRLATDLQTVYGTYCVVRGCRYTAGFHRSSLTQIL